MQDDAIDILIIDDEQISNIILTRYLELHADVKIHIERNGKDALSYLSQLNRENQSPRVIFLDLRMPIMDGFEFMDHYRKDFAENLNSKLVVLTSSMDQGDVQRTKEYDFVYNYLPKPINPEQINEVLTL